MTRSRAERMRCVDCRRPRDEVGALRDGVRYLSNAGLCPECGKRRMVSSIEADSTQDPEWWARYREGLARSVGARVPEPEREPSP